jgi:hypothetical protein
MAINDLSNARQTLNDISKLLGMSEPEKLDIKQELQLTVINLYNFNMERIKDFKLCDLMSYVESKDKECHHKFKLRFRKEGWII